MSTFLLSLAIIMLIAGLINFIWDCAFFVSALRASQEDDDFNFQAVIEIISFIFLISVIAIIFGIVGIIFFRT